MKIIIASDLHFPVINGAATFSRNLARGLAERGHEVVVISPSQTGKKYKEVDLNHIVARTVAVPFPFFQNIRVSLTPTREVKKIIHDFEPDIIHTQMMMWIGQAAMKIGNKNGIPVVSTNHSMPENLMDNLKLLAPLARPINYMLTEYGRRFHSKADFVTIPTQAAIDMFKASKRIKAPLVPVSNGIDLVEFSVGKASPKVYKKFNIPTDLPIITFVGRLDAEKHIPVLIKAFKRVLKSTPAHLLIVGDGGEASEIKLLVSDLDLKQNVTFTGRVSEEDKKQLHKMGTVFVMPSPMELQSIATLEAMASGMPVVAVDAGALKELCHDGQNGFLCEKDNDKEIADGIVKIITNPKLREKLSKKSLAIAKKNDLQHTLDQFIEIYSNLIK